MNTKADRRPSGTRKLSSRASLAELIAKSARKRKLRAKAELRAARISLNRAKKVAKRARKKAREAAARAGLIPV